MGGTTVECPRCGTTWRIAAQYQNECPNCGTPGVSVWRNYARMTKEEKEFIYTNIVQPLTEQGRKRVLRILAKVEKVML